MTQEMFCHLALLKIEHKFAFKLPRELQFKKEREASGHLTQCLEDKTQAMCIEGDSFGTKSKVLMEKPLSGSE